MEKRRSPATRRSPSQDSEFERSDNGITIICGANQENLENVDGMTIREVRRKMREILNIGNDCIVLVDGKEVRDENIILMGKTELEFKKPSGTKGAGAKN